jgi:hypothetical protein
MLSWRIETYRKPKGRDLGLYSEKQLIFVEGLKLILL